ncbi:MAG: SHOCT domain-containing protein [Candidatus Portnoybacteria bacterium]|nr:SHOCT domain-containing protein [Candidatus Portnoybacteria bacterium]
MMGNLNNMMMGYDWGTGAWMGGGLGWLFMIIFWAAVILGIVYLVKLVAGQGREERKEKSAFDILKERYARGEINKEEFEQKKKDLI